MLWVGMLLAFQEASPAAGAPEARGWDDFPVFVWREKYAGKPLPEELVEPFGGVVLMREEDSSWARERGLSYLIWNVAGRDALHLDADEAWNARVEQWIQTRDEKLLVREPCLNDPETLEKLFATLDATIARHGEPGLGFVLGDEVGLTPNGDPFDLCRCGFCEAKWKEYAQKNGLPERAPLTDEVRLDLLEDNYSSLGAWLARRRLDRELMTELLQALSERAHHSSPTSPVGLLGIAGTVFGGIDLAGGLPFLDFVECYPVGDTRELLHSSPRRVLRSPHGYSFGPRPRAALATVFVGEESPDGAAWRVWEHWMRGSNGLVLWSDQALAADPARAARLAQAVEDVRRIGRDFPCLLSPSFERIALVHDADSIALSWLKDALLDGATWPRRRSGFQEQNGTREKSVSRWLRELEDAGAFPASVPLSRLGESCFGGCRTLILAHLLVLGPEDVSQLEHQLDCGATLVVDGPLGWVDRNGRPWKEDVLQRLRARAPDQVRTTVDDLKNFFSSWKPVISAEEGSVSWLVNSRGTQSFTDVPPDQLVIALPYFRREDGALSKSLRLQVEPPPGKRLEWIHPAYGRELPPGDAVVLLLRAEER